MFRLKWYFHPLFVFIFSLLALGTSLFLYIHWYLQANDALRDFVLAQNLKPEILGESQNWIIFLTLSILVSIILAGILIIFIYYQKLINLYRLQHNFINGFTHELKTPIASLRLYLDTFKKYELPRADQEKYLDFMIQDTTRLSDNVSQILHLSKIENKGFLEDLKKREVVEILQKLIVDESHLFHKAIINLNNSANHKYYMQMNENLFDMLVINILSNAVKYNSSERPTIDITFTTRGQTLCIHFKDNGIGVEKAYKKKIFKKFYQVGTSKNMSAKGSGLGLYLVQNIARVHKWKIQVSSEGLGKGATFTLKIPYFTTE